LFGKGAYPLDIINNIVILNAWMGEFSVCEKRVCVLIVRAFVRLVSNGITMATRPSMCSLLLSILTPRYHSGKWKGLTYDDILNRGFVIDLFYHGMFSILYLMSHI
jgi:hypothetical protein